MPTDVRLADLVGAILHGQRERAARRAHVVAVWAGSDAAVVVTADSDDIVAVAAAVPATRVLIRTPASLKAG